MVGEVVDDDSIEIIGIGMHPSHGLKKGMIINIESTVQSIQRSVDEAELMSGSEINSVYIGIAGSHIRSLNSDGATAIKGDEITQADVDRVLDTARAVPIPASQKILHTLVQEYLIDGQDGIKAPIGMSGVRLESRVHMITSAVSAAHNIVKCVRRCGLEVADIALEQLASSQSVLAEDEKDLGVALIDIGGGTTDLAIFTEGAIRHTANIAIAGDQVTNDIAIALRTPIHRAEEIKLRYACALAKLTNPEEIIEVPSIGNRPSRRLARQILAEVVEPRYEELLKLVQTELQHSGFEELIAAGVVLTGGSSKMEGALELAEEILQIPVRIGMPSAGIGLGNVVCNPIYSTGVGLLQFGHAQQREQNARKPGNQAGTLVGRVKGWFQGNF